MEIVEWHSVSHVITPSLTRHYKMHNGISIPWDSGTLVCDMNEDGSVFRLHGNAYKSSANAAWEKMTQIPGASSYRGYKTFKVKAPSDGNVKWVDCAGIYINVDGLSAGSLNYDNICIGTDGYVYVAVLSSSPNNTRPLMLFFSGIVVHVDSSASSGGYIVGNGA